MRQTSDIQRFGFQQEHFSDVVVADQLPNLEALVSHELRTPLTSLFGVLELLNSGHFGSLSEEGEYFLKIAIRSINRLKRLADAISEEPAISLTILSNQKLAELQLENDFLLAFDRQEIQLCYQPIVASATGEITGFEAVVRWHHPQQGYIPANIVISLAEKTGLLHRLALWSLEKACHQLQVWQQQFVRQPLLTMSVNLAASQFSQVDLVEHIQQILQATTIAPTCLKLKITTSTSLQPCKQAIATLSQLHSLGIPVYIDDFSSICPRLGWLKELPIDILTLNRALIQDQNREMSGVISRIAEQLGPEVMAERIET